MHVVLKHFARDLLNGVWMDVLLDDGSIMPCFVRRGGPSLAGKVCHFFKCFSMVF